MAALVSLGSKVKPILVRIPDMKMIYLEDNLSCMSCWDADAAFLPYGTTGVEPGQHAPSTFAGRTSASMEAFSLDGRRLTPAVNAQKHGVVVRWNEGMARGVRELVD